VRSPLLAHIVLHHLAGRWEAPGAVFVRDAADCVVRCTTPRQAEKALAAVTACVEDALGLALNGEKTQSTTLGQGVAVLG
jgi:hypothetical protein